MPLGPWSFLPQTFSAYDCACPAAGHHSLSGDDCGCVSAWPSFLHLSAGHPASLQSYFPLPIFIHLLVPPLFSPHTLPLPFSLLSSYSILSCLKYRNNFLSIFPVLLRDNWHTSLGTFKVSKMTAWFHVKFTCEMITIGSVDLHHLFVFLNDFWFMYPFSVFFTVNTFGPNRSGYVE